MSKGLPAAETLAQLDKLRGALREYAQKHQQSEVDFRARIAAETKAFEAGTEKQKAQLADALAQAQAAHEAEEARCVTHFEKRKARINQAHKATREQVLQEIETQEGRRKHRLQEGGLEAERRRETGLAEAAATREQLHASLAETRARFVLLETAARKVFRGYWKFLRLLVPGGNCPEKPLPADPPQFLEELQRLHDSTQAAIDRFRKLALARVFSYLPAWLMALLLFILAAALPSVASHLGHLGIPSISYPQAGVFLGAAWVLLLIVHLVGRRQAGPAAASIAGDLERARRLHNACLEKTDLCHKETEARVKADFDTTTRGLNQDWKEAVREATAQRYRRRQEVDERGYGLSQQEEERHRATLEQLNRDYPERVDRLKREAQIQDARRSQAHAARLAKLDADHKAHLEALESECRNIVQPVYLTLQDSAAFADAHFPEWQSPRWDQWSPTDAFSNAAQFGRLEVNTATLIEAGPSDPFLAKAFPPTFSVPLLLTYPRHGSILFETGKTGGDEAVAAINNIIFRLLATNPPGKLSFTILDPVGLGQNFAGLMHLADYEQSHINSRIWTQSGQIEEKLAELSEHMEKVIQMYLRNEYETIAEYNAQAGTIAEKYHFLVVASFPVNFTDTAARRLLNIAASGARCGVYTLIHWDQRHTPPQDFVPDELRKNSVCLVRADQGFEVASRRLPGVQVRLSSPPSPELSTRFLHQIGQYSKDTNRVEVPFDQVAPPDGKLWSEETTEELQVPIGRSGATKLQYLAIGKATRQHGLIAGKTGSGKSTLFHVIVTNLALWASPEQVEFYLVDFKKGVEFKCYANRRLPHARVVAIESDREFGLSVLQRVDAELRRRGDLFRALGVQDLPGYKRAGGAESMPRSLLIIDEFQEFFVEEDRISQAAAVLLDRIVRQGRAFGIHVLLGSQTLGGAYTLARATIGQMVIRIALQCNEADAYLIMDQDNPAPRLLTRPGEGIYNDAAGAIEGNSPFQAVWLPEEVRDSYLAKVRLHADQSPAQYPPPFVFEGNAPANVQDNPLLAGLLAADSLQAVPVPRIWLGAPNSIKGPTEVAFQHQSGNNLLVVGQNEEASLTMLAVALVSLAAQHPPRTARFILLDITPAGSPQRDFLERVIQAMPHPIIQPNNSNLVEILTGLASELKNRTGDERPDGAPETYLLIQGLQNFKKLRQEDEFSFSSGDSSAANAAGEFLKLISDGPAHGFHTLATCDTYNNVTRFLGRKNLSEFEMRVLFQMSPSDSASLIDAPDAGTLGLHRALLYNDREGTMETFRPFALPDHAWVEQAAKQLRRLIPPSSS